MTAKLQRYGTTARVIVESEWYLASDFSTTSTTGNTVANLFIPEANSIYLLEAKLWVKGAATTTGVQMGIGGTVTSGSAAARFRFVTPASAVTETTTLQTLNDYQSMTASTTDLGMSTIDGIIYNITQRATASIALLCRSEVSGSAVTIAAGSCVRWKRVQ